MHEPNEFIMKKIQSLMSVIVSAIVYLFCVSELFADIEIVYIGGAHLPRESTGASWNQASLNRMQQIKNQLAAGNGNPVGTGKAISVVSSLDYKKLITTTLFENWNGTVLPGSGEYGNRYHVAFGIFANGGSSFIPADVQCTIQSYVYDNGTNTYISSGAISSTNLNSVNSFRQRMGSGPDNINGTADDVVSNIQSATISTNGFIFGGQGRGYPVSGSGDQQQTIDNTIAWLESNKLAIKYTCTIGGVHKEVWVFGNNQKIPSVSMLDKNTVRWVSTGEPVLFQRSENLNSWTPLAESMNWVWKKEGTITDILHGDLAPKMFYRFIVR